MQVKCQQQSAFQWDIQRLLTTTKISKFTPFRTKLVQLSYKSVAEEFQWVYLDSRITYNDFVYQAIYWNNEKNVMSNPWFKQFKIHHKMLAIM